MNKNIGIFWLRNDFRLIKNNALSFASNNHENVTAIYIFKKAEFEKKYPNQYLNVGVAEHSMMGVASGLALEGRIIFTYSIGNFPTLSSKPCSLAWSSVSPTEAISGLA